jgi:hypothetical protein
MATDLRQRQGSREHPNNKLAFQGTLELHLTKFALVLILLGFCFVRERIGAWPIMTWPMYSSRWPVFPESTVTRLELRIETREGYWYSLQPVDLFPLERVNVAENVIAAAWTATSPAHRRANRRYLIEQVQQQLPHVEIQTLQIWEMSWDVTPLALPPLDYANPSQVRLVGGFDITLESTVHGER